jgi:hypothetical protein
MIASASVARFDGLFRSSERSIHIAGIRNLVSATGSRRVFGSLRYFLPDQSDVKGGSLI